MRKLTLALILLCCGNCFGLTGYSFVGQISVDKTKVVADTTDFTVTLTSFPDAFYTACESDGASITVTQSDQTTKIDRKINGFSKTNKTLVLKFKAPSLSTTANTIFYLYAGKSGVSETNANPYGANYKTVYECEDTPSGASSVLDDTTNYNMTSVNMDSSNLTAGKIGNAYSFNGSDEVAYNLNRPSSSQTGTIYFWFNGSNIPNNTGTKLAMFSYNAYGGGYYQTGIGFYYYNKTNFWQRNGTGSSYYGQLANTTSISNSSWYFIAFRSNGSAWSAVVNNTSQTMTGNSYYDGTNNGNWFGDTGTGSTSRALSMGAYYDGTNSGDRFNGKIDYAHITDDQISNNDLGTIYNMTNSNSTFYSITEQSTSSIIPQVQYYYNMLRSNNQ